MTRLVRLALILLLADFLVGIPSVIADVSGAAAGFDYGSYANTLKTYVSDKALVSYKTLKVSPADLDAFLGAVAKLDPKLYVGWTEKEKVAFWLNAYNACTLKAIKDHYPIQASWLKSKVYPTNSIRQISGVWDKLQFTVMGRPMTLEEMEHGTLRKEFHEPRIHLALVCAAMGCPPLRGEPYIAARLDEQFADQARRLLHDPLKFRIDRTERTVYLSPIFKWFGDDFVVEYAPQTGFGEFSAKERAVLNFCGGFMDKTDVDYLKAGGYTISYLPYDWSLNEQK